MGYLPIFTDVAGERCLVIGGEPVAEVRVRTLRDADAHVTVIAPTITTTLAEWEQAGRITVVRRRYQGGDLDGHALAFCTDLTEDLDAIVSAARALRLPLNVMDRPALCSFIVPAVVRRGDLQVAISTGGASPALAGIIRSELDELFGPEYESLLDLMRALRDHLRSREYTASERADLLRGLATDLRAAMLQHDHAAVEDIVARRLGIQLDELGVTLPAGR